MTKTEIAPAVVIPDSCREFFDKTIARAGQFDVNVYLTGDAFVSSDDGLRCGGYYDPDAKNKSLCVACGKPFAQWFSVFVHESCHMDQDIEQSDLWVRSEDVAADVVFEAWLAHRLELLPEQAKYWTKLVQEVEYDCEKRTVARIQEFNLPLDVYDYTRAANAYIYFYTLAARRREWYTVAPYNTHIIGVMQDKFLLLDEYWNISVELEHLYETYCFGGNHEHR